MCNLPHRRHSSFVYLHQYLAQDQSSLCRSLSLKRSIPASFFSEGPIKSTGDVSLVGDSSLGGTIDARLPTQFPIGVWRSDKGLKCGLNEVPMKVSDPDPTMQFSPAFLPGQVAFGSAIFRKGGYMKVVLTKRWENTGFCEGQWRRSDRSNLKQLHTILEILPTENFASSKTSVVLKKLKN